MDINNLQEGYFVASPTNGRRFVIADIHGCYLTLATLIQLQLQLTREDQIFFLGDYVNRGPNSLGVIELVMNLQKAGYQVYPLRGNHEEMLIEKLQMKDRLSDETRLISRTSFVYQINPKQRAWLEALPYYYILDNFYLVHGAINTQADEPLEDVEYMLWQRNTPEPAKFLKGKQLLHGHTNFSLEEIRQAVQERHDCIPLDNGCYKGCAGKNNLYDGYGSLCALELDTWTLYVQENRD